RADPVDARPGGQQRRQLGLTGGDPLQGRRSKGQPLPPPGPRPDRPPGQVLVPGQGDHWRTAVGPVWLGREVDMVAPPACVLGPLTPNVERCHTTRPLSGHEPRGAGRQLISFESVTKRFPDGTVAVDNVDLEVPEGDLTVLVGPSGCGKTTTLRMINRMIEATSGRIMVDGHDISQVDPPQLRRRIGYVIQQIGLFPQRTTGENICTVPELVVWDS